PRISNGLIRRDDGRGRSESVYRSIGNSGICYIVENRSRCAAFRPGLLKGGGRTRYLRTDFSRRRSSAPSACRLSETVDWDIANRLITPHISVPTKAIGARYGVRNIKSHFSACNSVSQPMGCL